MTWKVTKKEKKRKGHMCCNVGMIFGPTSINFELLFTRVNDVSVQLVN